jgi:NTP pyrophosphatase (non-canonical NTP hydrolase)
MSHQDIFDDVSTVIEAAQYRYGPFASTHEALGVAVEEWDELRAAIQSNDLGAVADECIDLAAVLVRLARACRTGGAFAARSRK